MPYITYPGETSASRLSLPVEQKHEGATDCTAIIIRLGAMNTWELEKENELTIFISLRRFFVPPTRLSSSLAFASAFGRCSTHTVRSILVLVEQQLFEVQKPCGRLLSWFNDLHSNWQATGKHATASTCLRAQSIGQSSHSIESTVRWHLVTVPVRHSVCNAPHDSRSDSGQTELVLIPARNNKAIHGPWRQHRCQIAASLKLFRE